MLNKAWHWRIATIAFAIASIVLNFQGGDGSPYMILTWVCMGVAVLMEKVDQKSTVKVYIDKEHAL